MTSNPKVQEVMEWQQEEGDELARTSALRVETTKTQLVRSHSSEQTRGSAIPALSFLVSYEKRREKG